MKKLSGKVFLLVSSFAVSLGLGEVVLRIATGAPQARPLPQVRYDRHPVRGFTLRPDQDAFTYEARVRVDQSGSRRNGSDDNHQAPVRILALGDSFTFGMGVSDAETWPSQLEERLSDATPEGVRVVNLGTVSYGVLQELDLLRERGLPRPPDVVIHGLFWNDYMLPASDTVITAEGYFAWDDPTPPASFLARAKRALITHSALAFSAQRALTALRDRNTGPAVYERQYRALLAGVLPPETWDPVEDFYRELKRLGVERGFETFVVVLPIVDLVGVRRSSDHPYPRYITQLLDSLEIPFLDGIALWEARGLGKETFLPHNRHLSARGYGVIAEELALALEKDPEFGALLSARRAQ